MPTRSATSRRCSLSGARRLLHQRQRLRRRRLGRAGIERRRRIVFDLQLDLAGHLLAFEDGRDRQREIDAGGDARAGDDVAVHDDALADRNGAERLEMLDRGPMAGRALALEQTRGAQHQRAGADRRDVFRARRLLAAGIPAPTSSSIKSCWPGPPGTMTRSSCGQSAKVTVGTISMPRSVFTGAIVWATRCTLVFGSRASTS